MALKDNLSYTVFLTEAGWIGLLGSSRGLSRTTLPQKSKEAAALSLGKTIHQAVNHPEQFPDLIEQYQAYFKGYAVDFSEKLNLSQATRFERAVWETTRRIPRGETRSYGWVADQIGQRLASRAVGQALGRNPLPIIIPCHRVLTGSGKLGGFGGGLVMKQYLLKLEAGKSLIT